MTDPGDRVLARTCLALFALALVSSAYFVQGVGMNQSSRFDLVRAIVEEHTLSIDAYAGNTIDKAEKDGHFYTDKAPGLSFASVPPQLVFHAIGWPGPARAPLAMHVLTVAVIGTSSAIAAALLLLTLVRMGIDRVPAAVAIVAWLLGTNAFGYLTLYYGHQFTAALLAISFSLIHACKGDASAGRSRWVVPLAGAVAAWASISEYPAAVAAGMLFLYGGSVLGFRRMWPFVVVASLPLALWMAYNARCFGGPLKLGYGSLVEPEFQRTIQRGFFGVSTPKLEALDQILFGEARGLLPLSSFLVLAVPGAILLVRRGGGTRREGWLALVVTVFFLLFNASYRLWHGGVSMGPRYLVPMLPFTIVLVARALQEAGHRRARPLRAAAWFGSMALVTVSVAMCTMTVAVMPELLDQRFIRSPGPGVDAPDMLYPLRTFVIPSFVRGYLGVKGTLPNGQMGIASTARGHEWDAYNLGEAMGLHGLASLLPLAAAWAVIAAAIMGPGTRRREGPT